MADQKFHFEIELSVLNHLGRNLYRNFITILGEAISNSWDADANNVFIDIDKSKNQLTVRDDGVGMSSSDFQTKFLSIGHSKRANGVTKTRKGRPFIGAKGIGKLALLSCSKEVVIITKKAGEESPTGGVIVNKKLDDVIESGEKGKNYELGGIDASDVDSDFSDSKSGTVLIFKDLNVSVRNTIDYIKQQIAMHFRFSLLDDDFKIFVGGALVGPGDLKKTYNATQFLWKLNNYEDAIYESFPNLERQTSLSLENKKIEGFVASVKKPSDLKVQDVDQRMGVDLFVNGRLRQHNILGEIPRASLVESYLHGQIFYNDLDADGKDRFTSSREGILGNDEKYTKFLDSLKRELLGKVLNQWDTWRLELRESGDVHNKKVSKVKRAAIDLAHEVAKDYRPKNKASSGGADVGQLPDGDGISQSNEGEPPSSQQVEEWIDRIEEENQYNSEAYARCFIAENLVRRFITHKGYSVLGFQKRIEGYKKQEAENLKNSGYSIPIRKPSEDVDYLGIFDLAQMAEEVKVKWEKLGEGERNEIRLKPSLLLDALNYQPIRNVIGHTGFLTEQAKRKLETIYDNLKHRVIKLLDDN